VYGPDAEAWEWLIGQAATARAGVELLRHRAAEAESQPTKRDWPELAEYACFSCHQGLTGTLTAPRPSAPKPGQLPWGSWLYPVARSVADSGADWSRPAAKPTGLASLMALFKGTDRPAPARVRATSELALGDLDRWLTALQATAEQRSRSAPLTPVELRAGLAHAVMFAGDVPKADAASTDWDRYTQGFLATAALYRATHRVDSGGRDVALEAELKALAAALRFPTNQDGPRWTPADRDRFAAQWAAVAAKLSAGGKP
jgi:hypothetical protein